MRATCSTLIGSKCCSPVIICPVIIIAVLAYIIQQLADLRVSREYSDLSVPHMQWTHIDSYPQFMIEYLTKYKTPLVLHGTPFTDWNSASWTVETLASKGDKIGHVLSKKGTKNIFRYYAADQPLSNLDSMYVEKDYKEIIYTAKTFFDAILGSFDGSYYYYASGGIELLNLGEVESEVNMRAMTFPSHLNSYSELGQVNFWLGRTNVTAYTHYDTSYNLHYIADGRKRFILIPPSSYSKLKLYPCLHQLYRQVSTDVLSDVGNLQEFLRGVNGFEVELMNGDTLYIPPYWFHCVITMETTISINIWSQSESFITMEGIYNSAIPFEADWGRIKLMKSLNHFIHLIIRTVLNYSDERIKVHHFVMDRIYRRYEAVFELRNNSKELEYKLTELNTKVSEYCLRTAIRDILDGGELKHLESRAEYITQQFLEIQPASVREINLANYIEHLVWRMLGTGNLIQLPVYLHECFDITDE